MGNYNPSIGFHRRYLWIF